MKNLSKILFTSHKANRYPINKKRNSLGVLCSERKNKLCIRMTVFWLCLMSLNSFLKAKYKFQLLQWLGSYGFEEDDKSISDLFLWEEIMTILYYQESINTNFC